MDEAAEKAAELAAQKEVKEEEVRAAVIAEFGFDEVDDAERIDKAVKKDMEGRKKLSDAIGQKIKHRTDADTLRNDPRLNDTPPPPPKPAEVDVAKTVEETLAKRDLADMDVSDEIKAQIGDWAKFKGISVKQAAQAPHIASQIETYTKEKAADEAALTRTNRSGGKTNFSVDGPPKVDMSTAEGQKTYDDWKRWAIAQQN